MTDGTHYLEPKDDGLEIRETPAYVQYKLTALATYITLTNNSMKDKNWRARQYIDLFAGPGKNKIGSSIVLGSPLIALTLENPFTHYQLNEMDSQSRTVLEQRVSASPFKERVRIYQKDANEIITHICTEIQSNDRVRDGRWSTLNVAFLDPEGLELEWRTVEALARMAKMDLIINFSTMGLLRNIEAGNHAIINRYMGTDEWKSIYSPSANASYQRRALIDFYLSQLTKFGYNVEIDPNLGGDDIAVKNSNNGQVYSLIFASKNPLGDKFWKASVKKSTPPRLPGFD